MRQQCCCLLLCQCSSDVCARYRQHWATDAWWRCPPVQDVSGSVEDAPLRAAVAAGSVTFVHRAAGSSPVADLPARQTTRRAWTALTRTAQPTPVRLRRRLLVALRQGAACTRRGQVQRSWTIGRAGVRRAWVLLRHVAAEWTGP